MFALSATAQGATTSATQPIGAVKVTDSALPKIRARVLRPGVTGDDVRALQQLLGAVGLPVTVNGQYLEETATAVQRFQFVARMKASGIAGPLTITALRTAARGPDSVETSGGLSFGKVSAPKAKLGNRIPVAAGMSGRDIRELQDWLRRADVRGAPRPTGEFRTGTRIAVRRFERSVARKADGVLDAGDIYELRTRVGGEAAPGDLGDPMESLPAPKLAPGDRAQLAADGTAIAPENAPDEVKQIIAAGNKIAKKPYLWGGGHGRWEDSGYDCSGSVSYALRGAGLMKSPLASYDFFDWGKSGAGQWVTIYTNSGHMYMVVAGLRFDTSGRGPKGSRWQKAMRENSGYKVRHPAGL
ncbi:unannotated protein [freshwater metagenome]|uniref:Unannotated protein n=1 Tax=freshwater metagenome TaxID=449393 RepID=A0A6J7ITX4_9ZZZZ